MTLPRLAWVSVEQALAWVEDPPLTAASALEVGMIDALSYRDQVEDGIDETLDVVEGPAKWTW